MSNEALINEFYTCFKNRDFLGMACCYHPRVEFSDPIFPALKGVEVSAMWALLVSKGKDTKISFSNIHADDKQGSCRWEAVYSYGPKKRRVHNFVTSKFEFQDGKILRQVDSFDLWQWQAMALGPVGSLLGWSSFLKGKVRKLAEKSLRDFIKSHPEYRSQD